MLVKFNSCTMRLESEMNWGRLVKENIRDLGIELNLPILELSKSVAGNKKMKGGR